MPPTAYHLHLPTRACSAVVFASPHSGRDYPAALMRASVLDAHAIRSSEDAFVDRLFDCAPDLGAPLIAGAYARAYVDLNRAADELDPALIEGVRRGTHNPRVASGLGVVPRVVAGGRAIYRGKLPRAEAVDRVRKVWAPYHARLQTLLQEARGIHGQAILIDCHSMPHEAVATGGRGARRAEIVIGDRFGASSDPEIVDRVEAAFASAGFAVARNAPFAGAYVAQHYGRPAHRQHAIQIEIDRALYMNEATIRPTADFDAVRAALRGVVAELVTIGRADPLSLAAE